MFVLHRTNCLAFLTAICLSGGGLFMQGSASDSPVSIITGANDPHTIFGGIPKDSAQYGELSSSPWFVHSLEARDALRNGQLEQANTMFRTSIAEAETAGALNPGVVNCLCGLSLLHDKEGKSAEAERLYELAMRTVEGLSGRNSIEFARLLPDLAWLYVAHGKPDKAEPILRQAVEIHKRSDGEVSLAYARSLEHYAEFLKTQNRRTESLDLIDRAQLIRKHLESNQ